MWKALKNRDVYCYNDNISWYKTYVLCKLKLKLDLDAIRSRESHYLLLCHLAFKTVYTDVPI